MIQLSILGKARNFSLKNPTHPAFSSFGTGGSFPGEEWPKHEVDHFLHPDVKCD